jgi:hypothetical protein
MASTIARTSKRYRRRCTSSERTSGSPNGRYDPCTSAAIERLEHLFLVLLGCFEMVLNSTLPETRSELMDGLLVDLTDTTKSGMIPSKMKRGDCLLCAFPPQEEDSMEELIVKMEDFYPIIFIGEYKRGMLDPTVAADITTTDRFFLFYSHYDSSMVAITNLKFRNDVKAHWLFSYSEVCVGVFW